MYDVSEALARFVRYVYVLDPVETLTCIRYLPKSSVATLAFFGSWCLTPGKFGRYGIDVKAYSGPGTCIYPANGARAAETSYISQDGSK